MKKLIAVLVMGLIIGVLSSCNSLPVLPTNVTPQNVITNVVPSITTNDITIAVDKSTLKAQCKEVCKRLNSKYGYMGLVFLVLAAVLTSLLINLKKRKLLRRKF